MMMAVGWVCLKDNSYTFEARGHRSVLDLTLIESRWDPSLFQWRVLREQTASDHFVTLMTMKEALPPIACPRGYPRFTSGQINKIVDRAAKKLSDCRVVTPSVLQDIIIGEMARIPLSNTRRPVYWWNAGISEQRRKHQLCRRKKHRTLRNGGPAHEMASVAFAEVRSTLNYLIKQAKRDKWIELCTERDNDPWDRHISWSQENWGDGCLP